MDGDSQHLNSTDVRALAEQKSLASQETKTVSDASRKSVQSQVMLDGDELVTRFKGVEDGSCLNEQMDAWQESITASDVGPRYQMDELLGLGAQGLVFSVSDKDCGRKVALKTMRGEGRMPTQIARFVHEAQVTAQLEHPGVVPVHELNVLPDGTLFYTMKKVEGRPLSDEIRLNVRYLDKRFNFLQIFLKICETMSFAHSHGVLHRDLKPANIMLGDYGEVLVLDWGLSKVMGQADVVSVRSKNAAESESGIYVTREGHAVGTPAYMSPEQARGHRDSLDERSDIYSLGIILYEMLSGNLPYTGVDVDTVLEQVANGHLVPIVRQPISQNVSPQLAAIVHKAIAFKPEERYAKVDELTSDLQSYLAGEAVTAYADNLPERIVRFMRRNQAQVKTGGILSALFLFMITVFYVYKNVSDGEEIYRNRADAFYYLVNGRYEEAREAFNNITNIDANDLLANTGSGRANILKKEAERQRKEQEELLRKQEIKNAEEKLRREQFAQKNAAVKRLLDLVQKETAERHWADALNYYNQAYSLMGEVETDGMKDMLAAIENGRLHDEKQQMLELIKEAETQIAQKRLNEAWAKVNGILNILRNDKFDLRNKVVALRDQIKEQIDQNKIIQEQEERARQLARLLERYDAQVLTREDIQKQLLQVKQSLLEKQRKGLDFSEWRSDEQRIKELQNTLTDQDLIIVTVLGQAQEIDPESVRRHWADYYERDLRRAERRGDNTAATVAARRGASYDKEGRYRLLFSERAEFSNAHYEPVYLSRLDYDDAGALVAGGERVQVKPGERQEVGFGRHLVSIGEQSFTSLKLSRGEIFKFEPHVQANENAQLRLVPAGYIYDDEHSRDPQQVAAFWMMQHEVTCGEYLQFVNDSKIIPDKRLKFAPRNLLDRKPIWRMDSRGRFRLEHYYRQKDSVIDPQLPVYGLSYETVLSFIAWKRKRSGLAWRLPTEREWRLAAQSGDGRIFPWGDRPDPKGALCYSARSSGKQSAEVIKPVMSFTYDQSVNGIYDLGGSLSEFVLEKSQSQLVTICGGSFQDGNDFRFKTTSVRKVDKQKPFIQVGFRLVLDLDKEE